ncbi:MAG: CRISPR-associated helicase Cas3' [Clostridiaceae bacterium]|nr:CRISPR-associated helicase Cas3' [Clostridiaceae bacterium]
MYYISRISNDGREQLTTEHIQECAEYAQMLGAKLDAPMLTRLAGMLHDMGKFSAAFVEYLRKSYQCKKNNEPPPQKGTVVHAIQGAKFLYEKLYDESEYKNDILMLMVKEILSLCIIGHHGKMTDVLTAAGDTPLLNKIEKKNNELYYDEVKMNFLNEEALIVNSINEISEACRNELDNFIKKCKELNFNISFMIHLFTKFIFSCLIDADRYNAYCFETGNSQETEIKIPVWDEYAKRLEDSISEFTQDSEISLIRNDISLKCLTAAEHPQGIYQLSVPTGGGKTLSSLRFALNHAKNHKMHHIIYVIPYLSVLEQTAKNINEALKHEYDENFILEHHSNIELPENENDAQIYKLYTDRWSHPIVITTMVQFLESIYSEKSGKLRKIHNLLNSVIIFDEIQSIPIKCIHLFNEAINFLHHFGNCSILLCTATQPLLDKVDIPIRLSVNSELVSDTKDRFEKLKRTRIIDITKQGGYSFEELCNFVFEKLNEKKADNCLIILNTKKDAAELYRIMKNKIADSLNNKHELVHLSTSMCPIHRLDVLNNIKSGKTVRKGIICISTQLIEAGVDISFSCVFRANAGLDSIAQAAGRCNRNGENPNCCDVFIINLAEEDLSKLPDIKCGRDETNNILEKKEVNLLTKHIMEEYYERYFFKRKNVMNYDVKPYGTLYDLLSCNIKGTGAFKNAGGKRLPALRQAFQTAGELFFVIEPNTTVVIVPYGKGKTFEKNYKKSDIKGRIRLVREMGRYSISLYLWEIKKLEVEHALRLIDDGIYVLDEKHYDLNLGVVFERENEFLIVEGR